jgi:hypothetical protein
MKTSGLGSSLPRSFREARTVLRCPDRSPRRQVLTIIPQRRSMTVSYRGSAASSYGDIHLLPSIGSCLNVLALRVGGWETLNLRLAGKKDSHVDQVF